MSLFNRLNYVPFQLSCLSLIYSWVLFSLLDPMLNKLYACYFVPLGLSFNTEL